MLQPIKEPWHWMKVNVQLHNLAVLPYSKASPLLTEQSLLDLNHDSSAVQLVA